MEGVVGSNPAQVSKPFSRTFTSGYTHNIVIWINAASMGKVSKKNPDCTGC